MPSGFPRRRDPKPTCHTRIHQHWHGPSPVDGKQYRCDEQQNDNRDGEEANEGHGRESALDRGFCADRADLS